MAAIIAEQEIWKDIPEFEKLYQASSSGNIRSLDRIVTSKLGINRFYKGKLLKLTLGQRYVQVGLHRNGKMINKLVHVLIATTFHEKPCYNCEVLHINNIKTDNRSINLKWGTHFQNIQDSVRDGLYPGAPFGWQRAKCKFNKEIYKRVFELYNEGHLNKERISKSVGVQSGTVHKWLKTYVKHKEKIDNILNICSNPH